MNFELSFSDYDSTETNRTRIKEAVLRVSEEEKKDPSIVVMPWSRLRGIITPDQMELISHFRELDPVQLGFYGAQIDSGDDQAADTGQEYKVLEGQLYTYHGEKKSIRSQFVPRHVYQEYERLNEHMRKDGLPGLLVGSGYRSPAYQMMVFLTYLSRSRADGCYDFDLEATAKRVALPGYSEHADYQHPALDLLTQTGSPDDINPLAFEETPEYSWLTENAHDYGFYLTYPRGNKMGVEYEPWHWRWMGKTPR